MNFPVVNAGKSAAAGAVAARQAEAAVRQADECCGFRSYSGKVWPDCTCRALGKHHTFPQRQVRGKRWIKIEHPIQRRLCGSAVLLNQEKEANRE